MQAKKDVLKEIGNSCVLVLISVVISVCAEVARPVWGQQLPVSSSSKSGQFSEKAWASFGRKANAYERFGQLEKAEQYYQLALEESRKPGASPDSRGSTLLDLAGLLSKLGKSNEAIACYEQCLAVRRKQWGEKSQRLDSIMEGLAKEGLKAHRIADAGSILRELLAIRSKVLLPNDPKMIVTLWMLEDVYTQQGKMPEAIEIHKRYMAAKAQNGQSTQALANDLSLLASLYARHKNWVLAEEIRRRELSLRTTDGDKGSVALQSTLYRLAECQKESGKWDEAITNLRLGLAMSEKVNGKQSKELIQFLGPLCNSCLEAKRYPEAEVACKRKLKIQEVAFGKNDAKTRRTIGKLVKLYSEWGKPNIAQSYSMRLDDAAVKPQRK
jgi:tetratricopeptide (TPR) repeat protein